MDWFRCRNNGYKIYIIMQFGPTKAFSEKLHRRGYWFSTYLAYHSRNTTIRIGLKKSCNYYIFLWEQLKNTWSYNKWKSVLRPEHYHIINLCAEQRNLLSKKRNAKPWIMNNHFPPIFVILVIIYFAISFRFLHSGNLIREKVFLAR